MSLLLAVKLFAAPLLIGLASLAGKRWGPNAAGLMGGLPLVGGPVAIAVWMADGPARATELSLAAPVGVWATMSYLLTVGYASARLPWHLTILGGWACYLAAAFLLRYAGLADNFLLSLLILPALWLALTRLLPRPAAPPPPARLPRIELAARMAAAVALVLALTAASDAIGPGMTGVLAGAPVAATVIPAFLMATAGRDSLLLALRGFLTGLLGFVVFFLVLARCIAPLQALAVLPALAAAVATGLGATWLLHRRTR